MKPILHLLPGIVLCIAIPFHSFSQCGPGLGPYTITYDTTVIGTGNGSYTFSFPKFYIPNGTFLAANINSVVNVGYTYTLENNDVSTRTYKPRILRTDDVSSDALDPDPISALNQTPIVSLTVAPSQQVTYGPAHMSYIVKDSVTAANFDTRLINFEGVGPLEFDYQSGSSLSFSGTLVGLNLKSIVVVDTTHFSITYKYCLNSLLSQDLLFFSATAQGKGQVLLNWRQLNIDNNRIYNLQVSTDGRIFKRIATVNENSSGNYTYNYFHNATTRLYFRIEEKEISGEIKYSEVRIIDPAPAQGVQIFPTLYTGGNLRINFPSKADWSVNMYSADGRRVAESKQVNTGNARIVLPVALSNGTYTAEVINLQTQQKQFARIIIQR